MTRTARIVERIVVAELKRLTVPLSEMVEKVHNGIVFIYSSDTDRLFKGAYRDMHQDLIDNIVREGEDEQAVFDRTLRGLWYNNEKLLAVYPLYLNGQYVDPPYRSLDRVCSILRIEPEKIYRLADMR